MKKHQRPRNVPAQALSSKIFANKVVPSKKEKDQRRQWKVELDV